jgi:hypothetical protein
MAAYHWTCPYCNRDVTLIDKNISVNNHYFNNGNNMGDLVNITTVLVCPNPTCKEFSVSSKIFAWEWVDGIRKLNDDNILFEWKLKPNSNAKPMPDYIPSAIVNDYYEACLIKDLSPKASATLSRRCLQGIIRDFWSIKKGRLIDEINALEENIDPLTWSAIDGLRKIGNIGAHMEKDINIITDVEPKEASLLLGLIENLITDWYVQKHDKEERYKQIVAASSK